MTPGKINIVVLFQTTFVSYFWQFLGRLIKNMRLIYLEQFLIKCLSSLREVSAYNFRAAISRLNHWNRKEKKIGTLVLLPAFCASCRYCAIQWFILIYAYWKTTNCSVLFNIFKTLELGLFFSESRLITSKSNSDVFV